MGGIEACISKTALVAICTNFGRSIPKATRGLAPAKVTQAPWSLKLGSNHGHGKDSAFKSHLHRRGGEEISLKVGEITPGRLRKSEGHQHCALPFSPPLCSRLERRIGGTKFKDHKLRLEQFNVNSNEITKRTVTATRVMTEGTRKENDSHENTPRTITIPISPHPGVLLPGRNPFSSEEPPFPRPRQ